MPHHEADLYPFVHDFLELRFREQINPLRGELRSVSAITATAGGVGTGTWSKPDLCLVALWRHKFATSWELDIHGFEVKPKGRCTADAVHEALNHSSHVHYTHLVWHKPDWNVFEKGCADLLRHCRRFGVGLITIDDPAAASTYVVRLEAERHNPSGDAVDEFLETRIPDDRKRLLLDWLGEVRR